MADRMESNAFMGEFLRGEQKAFSELFDAYFRQLWVYAYKLTGNEEESKDLAIQAFSGLFRRHADFSSLPAIRAFLYVVVRNGSFNFLKSSERMNDRKARLQELLSQDAGTEAAELDGEVLQLLYESLEKLPVESRRVLKMLYFDGLKYREVAQLLGISVETVKSQRKYALEKLRKALSQKQFIILLFLYPHFAGCVVPS